MDKVEDTEVRRVEGKVGDNKTAVFRIFGTLRTTFLVSRSDYCRSESHPRIFRIFAVFSGRVWNKDVGTEADMAEDTAVVGIEEGNEADKEVDSKLIDGLNRITRRHRRTKKAKPRVEAP